MSGTYELGSIVLLGVEVRDAAGALADATAVTCTVTLPDGTTATPTPAHPSTGVYTVDYPAPAAGRYVARWVATGANASAESQVFRVVDRGDDLVDVADLSVYLDESIDPADDRAQQLLRQASAVVVAYCSARGLPATALIGQESAALVALRVASGVWKYPTDRESGAVTPQSASWNRAGQPMILTGADKATLDDLVSVYRATRSRRQARSVRLGIGWVDETGTR